MKSNLHKYSFWVFVIMLLASYLLLFEKQVLSFYHNAQVIDSPDDYNIFNESGATSASYATLSEKAVMPIHTYEDMDQDPMNTVLNAFSKLKHQGEGAAIQFVVAPAGNKFIDFTSTIFEWVFS